MLGQVSGRRGCQGVLLQACLCQTLGLGSLCPGDPESVCGSRNPLGGYTQVARVCPGGATWESLGHLEPRKAEFCVAAAVTECSGEGSAGGVGGVLCVSGVVRDGVWWG